VSQISPSTTDNVHILDHEVMFSFTEIAFNEFILVSVGTVFSKTSVIDIINAFSKIAQLLSVTFNLILYWLFVPVSTGFSKSGLKSINNEPR
jgi:hypothetical protein